MANLYATSRSVIESARIERGRTQLRSRLGVAPYSAGQGASFALGAKTLNQTRLGREYDVFSLQGVTAPLAQCWRVDETRYGFIVNAQSTSVSVPLNYYTSAYAFPFDVDTALVSRLVAWLSVAGAALWAYALL